MSGRAAATTICGALAVALVIVAPVSGDSATTRCRTRGETLAQNSKTRVYRVYGHREPAFTINEDYFAFGCLLHSGKTRKLGSFVGSDPQPDGVYAFAVGGRYVAYDRIDCAPDACYGRFHIRNLVTNRTTLGHGIAHDDNVVRDDVVTAHGSAAWIRESRFGNFTVRGLEHGHEKLLDSGRDIDPQSMYRHGRCVYWRRGGMLKSARLD